jgi:hypothetical protein
VLEKSVKVLSQGIRAIAEIIKIYEMNLAFFNNLRKKPLFHLALRALANQK